MGREADNKKQLTADTLLLFIRKRQIQTSSKIIKRKNNNS